MCTSSSFLTSTSEVNTTEMIKLQPLTLTFEPLLGEPPQQSATVFTEGRTLVVVDFKPVRHVDLEALLVDLKDTSHIIQLIIKAVVKVKVKIVHVFYL